MRNRPQTALASTRQRSQLCCKNTHSRIAKGFTTPERTLYAIHNPPTAQASCTALSKRPHSTEAGPASMQARIAAHRTGSAAIASPGAPLAPEAPLSPDVEWLTLAAGARRRPKGAPPPAPAARASALPPAALPLRAPRAGGGPLDPRPPARCSGVSAATRYVVQPCGFTVHGLDRLQHLACVCTAAAIWWKRLTLAHQLGLPAQNTEQPRASAYILENCIVALRLNFFFYRDSLPARP